MTGCHLCFSKIHWAEGGKCIPARREFHLLGGSASFTRAGPCGIVERSLPWGCTQRPAIGAAHSTSAVTRRAQARTNEAAAELALVGNKAQNNTDQASALRLALDLHYPTELTISLRRDIVFVTIPQMRFKQIKDEVHIPTCSKQQRWDLNPRLTRKLLLSYCMMPSGGSQRGQL